MFFSPSCSLFASGYFQIAAIPQWKMFLFSFWNCDTGLSLVFLTSSQHLNFSMTCDNELYKTDWAWGITGIVSFLAMPDSFSKLPKDEQCTNKRKTTCVVRQPCWSRSQHLPKIKCRLPTDKLCKLSQQQWFEENKRRRGNSPTSNPKKSWVLALVTSRAAVLHIHISRPPTYA